MSVNAHKMKYLPLVLVPFLVFGCKPRNLLENTLSFGVSQASESAVEQLTSGEVNEAKVRELADALNKELSVPVMLDESIRLNSIDADGLSLVYNYELIGYSSQEVAATVQNLSLGGVCNALNGAFKNGLRGAVYNYSRSEGSVVRSFRVQSSQCGY